MSENGRPHTHRWRLSNTEEGRAYDWTHEDLGTMPFRPVTLRTFYCERCREVVVDKTYGEWHEPVPPPTRKPGIFQTWWPKSLRPW